MTYVAITTTNAAAGLRPVAHGPDRAEADRVARQLLNPEHPLIPQDLYVRTLLRNLRVVPLSRVSRGVRRQMDRALDSVQEMATVVGCQPRHLRALAVLAAGDEHVGTGRPDIFPPDAASQAAVALRCLDIDAPASVSGDWREASLAFLRELAARGYSIHTDLAD